MTIQKDESCVNREMVYKSTIRLDVIFLDGDGRMELVACEISPGLRASEATVAVRSFDGDQQFLRLERDFLNFRIGFGSILPYRRFDPERSVWEICFD